jgi:hypothetical protein
MRFGLCVSAHKLTLIDLDSELLILGLSEALQTATGWLTPAQLYDICVGGSRAERMAQEAAEVWAWLLRYIDRHGRDGHASGGAYLGMDEEGGFIIGEKVEAPEIPDMTGRTLTLLGGTVRGGLDKIGLASMVELPFVKKEFATTYVRTARLG